MSIRAYAKVDIRRLALVKMGWLIRLIGRDRALRTNSNATKVSPTHRLQLFAQIPVSAEFLAECELTSPALLGFRLVNDDSKNDKPTRAVL